MTDLISELENLRLRLEGHRNSQAVICRAINYILKEEIMGLENELLKIKNAKIADLEKQLAAVKPVDPATVKDAADIAGEQSDPDLAAAQAALAAESKPAA